MAIAKKNKCANSLKELKCLNKEFGFAFGILKVPLLKVGR